MLYIVFTTGQCNLRCIYCSGSFPSNIVPWKVKYSIRDLIRFIEDDPDPIIAFYGGEPLLNHAFIEEVMDSIDWAKYVIQTNGTLIHRLNVKYWRLFDAVLLSIDGTRDVTDYYRGRGVYEKVVEAAGWLRRTGFNGDLIARMAVSEESDIYRDVAHLLSLGLFDHIHWQLDVVWSNRWRDFDGWLRSSYMPGLAKLVDYWVDKMKGGDVIGIAPFKAIAYAVLTGNPLEKPPCGAGSSAYAISTDGRILACPIAVYERWAEAGHILRDKPETLRKYQLDAPCIDCPYLAYCGGRCLYAHKERLWGEEGFRKICDATRYLIDKLKVACRKIDGLLKSKVISLDEIKYPPFNNTVEIIP